MTISDMPQGEADALFSLAKYRVDGSARDYPGLGGAVSIPLISADRRKSFFLDLRRSRIAIAKRTHQNRESRNVILARLDFGPPHRNPDGEEIGSPHLHRYKEGYGDKWAYPVPDEHFPDLSDPWRALDDFMKFCNIVEPPVIQRGLFS